MPISRIPFPILAKVNNLILLVFVFINFLTNSEANHATLSCIESLASELTVPFNQSVREDDQGYCSSQQRTPRSSAPHLTREFPTTASLELCLCLPFDISRE